MFVLKRPYCGAVNGGAPPRGFETGRAMSFTIAHITDPHLSPAPPPFGANFRLKRFMGYVNW